MTWHASPFEPYVNVVHFTDGTQQMLTTLERPKMLFNDAGVPTHLINGVCGGATYCAPRICCDCKYAYWDYTLVQPLG